MLVLTIRKVLYTEYTCDIVLRDIASQTEQYVTRCVGRLVALSSGINERAPRGQQRRPTMAWNDTGEERVRKFKAYQELEGEKRDLERRYNAANERIAILLEEVERQKAKINELAQGLRKNKESRPPPAKSQTQLSVRDILDQLATMIEEKTGTDAK